MYTLWCNAIKCFLLTFSTNTSLLTFPILSVHYYTGNMLGIIIISVVVCAILTSIVWVVIIYKTRRRMRMTAVMQTEMQELPETASRSDHTHEQLMTDNISEHSSCKDSGTGDSAKRSSDDLAPKEFSLIMNGDAVLTMNNSHAPLLHYPQSTNHDRILNGKPGSSTSKNVLSWSVLKGFVVSIYSLLHLQIYWKQIIKKEFQVMTFLFRIAKSNLVKRILSS